MSTVDEIVKTIARVNEEGVEHFTNDVTVRCNGVEAEGMLDYCATATTVATQVTAIEFRAIAIRVASTETELVAAAGKAGYRTSTAGDHISIEPAAVRLFAGDWPEGVERDTHGYIDGLAPTIVELVPTDQRGTRGVDVMRRETVPFRDDIELEIGGHAHGTATVTGEWNFYVREWGFKEVYLTLQAIRPHARLTLGLPELAADTWSLAGRHDVTSHVHAFWAENALHLAVRGVELRRQRRPETSTIYQLRSRTSKHGAKPTPYVFGFAPELSLNRIVRLLESERDPQVAAQAAYLAGEHGIVEAIPALIGCLTDESEAPDVINNALWAVAKLKASSAIPAIEALVATIGESAIGARVAIDPASALVWLEQQIARGDALGARCAGYLEAHPAIAVI